jgi:hypothetical protein
MKPKRKRSPVDVDAIDNYRSPIDGVSIAVLALSNPDSAESGQTIDGIDDKRDAIDPVPLKPCRYPETALS